MVKSFRDALRGIGSAFRSERNVRVHLGAAILVFIAMRWLGIGKAEGIVLLLCIGAVMAAELFNSAIESLSDVVQPEHDERIRRVKDVSAGAVLVLAVISAIIGLIVLLPPLLQRINP